MSHSSDDLLLHSVSEFNAWRRDNLEVPIDLAGRDLSGADLRRAFLAGATMDGCRLDDVDLDALLSGASLAGASLQRADLRGPQAHGFLSAVVHELGLTQADVDRLGPRGRLVLEEIEVAPPTSQWARRIAVVLLFGVAQTGSAVSGAQLHALVHFGGQLGFGDRAMMRLIREELGVDLSPADDDDHE